MRDKRDFWQQIAMSAIMSGRATTEIAVRTADDMVEQYEKRRKQWDAEEAAEREAALKAFNPKCRECGEPSFIADGDGGEKLHDCKGKAF